MLEHRGWLADARILDCFAGTGALGIEALSRGAKGAIFVESSAVVVRTLRGNLEAAGVADRSLVLSMDVGRALRALARDGVVVDGVLADPPYHQGWPQRVVDAVSERGVLSEHGWMAIEHASDESVAPAGNLVAAATRRHGSTTLTLLERSA
jgi:16S rRNA (guanine(966)-N(2))-methyltransferase RsmD